MNKYTFVCAIGAVLFSANLVMAMEEEGKPAGVPKSSPVPSCKRSVPVSRSEKRFPKVEDSFPQQPSFVEYSLRGLVVSRSEDRLFDTLSAPIPIPSLTNDRDVPSSPLLERGSPAEILESFIEEEEEDKGGEEGSVEDVVDEFFHIEIGKKVSTTSARDIPSRERSRSFRIVRAKKPNSGSSRSLEGTTSTESLSKQLHESRSSSSQQGSPCVQTSQRMRDTAPTRPHRRPSTETNTQTRGC